MYRQQLYNEIINLSKSNNNLLLEWATGAGKSLGFILIQEELKPKSVLIVIAERMHKQNWIEEYKKHNKEYLLNNVEFVCYAGLRKVIDNVYDLICLDEVHNITELRIEYLEVIRTKKFIALSATVKNSIKELLNEHLGTFFVHKVNMNDIISNNLVNEPKFIIHKIVITDKNILKKLKTLDETVEYYKRQLFLNRKSSTEFLLKRAGLNRKKYIASIKTPYIKEFMLKHTKRCIYFCESIAQCNELDSSEFIINSSVKNNKEILDNFNNEIINKIYVIKMFREGMNLSNIESVVICQLDSTSKRFIQESGRGLRAVGYPEIHIFYVHNTVDELFTQNSIKEINSNYISYE